MRLNAHLIRSSMLRALAAFCGVNLLVLAPVLFLLFRCSPQEIELETFGDDVLEIAISDATNEDGTVNYCSSVELFCQKTEESGKNLFKGRFPRVFDFKKPAFFIRSDTATSLMIGSMRRHVGLFGWTLSPKEITVAYHVEGSGKMAISSDGILKLPLSDGCCRLVPDKIPQWGDLSFHGFKEMLSDLHVMVILILELLMLAVAIAQSLRNPVSLAQMHWLQSAGLSLIAVYFLFCVVPLQSYYSNITEFPFTAIQLLCDVIPSSIAVFFVVLVGLSCSEFAFGRVVHFVMFAWLVYEFLEVGVLSCSAPPMMGDLSYYANSGLEQRDWLVFAYAFVFLLVPYVKIKDYLPWMMAAFFIMSSAALIDVVASVRTPARSEERKLNGRCGLSEVPMHVKFSSGRNIIVFVIDSVTSEVAKDVVREAPGLATMFDGFVAFDCNLGMMYRTEISTVGILAGEYYRGDDNMLSMVDFSKKACCSGSVFLDYLESAFSVYCMGPAAVFGCGYASEHAGRAVAAGIAAAIEEPLFWRTRGCLATSIFNLSVFRMTPFGCKRAMNQWMSPYFGFAEESYVYPYLRAAPVVESEGSFIYCHTKGAHFPHDVSGSGLRQDIFSAPDYQSYVNQAKPVINELGRTMDALKDKRVYDNASILIIADHGIIGDNLLKGRGSRKGALPSQAFPMLWVKPANSHGPIVFDETTPTTHANLHKVLRSLKDRDLDAAEIAAMLSSDRRVFIRQTRDGYDQWDVAPDGTVLSRVHKVVK